MLPLTPTIRAANHSPYTATSAFAGNPLVLSLELLVRDGLLDRREIARPPRFDPQTVDFEAVHRYKLPLVERAARRFFALGRNQAYEWFCDDSRYWLGDFALFDALRHHLKAPDWSHWPPPLRNRNPAALAQAAGELRERIQRTMFYQWMFFRQWMALRKHCNNRGLQLFGDVPIYVAYDCADTWAHPHVFQLDRFRRPRAVAGMPPSRFNENGQFWGMPLFAWRRLARGGYQWWLQRMAQNFRLYNWVRIDHFLGFVSYWKIPITAESPKQGRWLKGPRDEFFRVLLRRFGTLPLVAEDLGFVSAESREIMLRYRLPGMRVMVDGFSAEPEAQRFLPHNHVRECVAYTSTHDSDTVRGWFESADTLSRRRFFAYVGRRCRAADAPWELLRLGMMSSANALVTPLQDLLALGSDARMNRPGVPEGNWMWRLRPRQLRHRTLTRLRKLTALYGRS
jgi:4-alpha-glucanotransferase